MGSAPGIAAIGLILPASIDVWQDRLPYFPARATVEEMASPGLQPWPSARAFRGLVAEPSEVVRGTAVVFHGNAGHAGHRVHYARGPGSTGGRSPCDGRMDRASPGGSARRPPNRPATPAQKP